MGSGLLVVGLSVTGGGRGETSPCPATIGTSKGKSGISVAGCSVVGLSVAKATHSIVGLPVVPGGHVHFGILATVWQLALSAHGVEWQTSMQSLLMQLLSKGHWFVLSQPIGSCAGGITVDGRGGGGCVGLIVGNSTIGGGNADDGPCMGMGGTSLTTVSSVTGLGCVVGRSVDIAVHPYCGSPVVP